MFDINKCVGIYAADIETTGLLDDLYAQGANAKLHNFSAKSIESGNSWTYHGTPEGRSNIAAFLDRHIILIMHNGIDYDKKALEFFGFDVSKVLFVDTLALSWYLDRDRPKHGLESYGVEFGVPKPVISDWESLTQEDYDNRVEEDVKIQDLTYRKLKARFQEIYGPMSDSAFCTHRCVRYLMFKMEQLANQADNKILVDYDKVVEFHSNIDVDIQEKFENLIKVMPKVPKYAKRKRPKEPFKKNRELSEAGKRWQAVCDEYGVDFDFDGEVKVVVGYDEPNPASSDQVKNWLFSLGWVPMTFNYVKEEDGSTRTIPQVYIKGSGGMVCPSVSQLAEDNPDVAYLEGLGVMKHRKGLAAGFINIIDEQGHNEVVAGAQGFTNTLRLKHRKPCVNLPSLRSAYGESIRGFLIAREGKMFCGADLSALENILKFNFQYPYDPEYVMSQMRKDFDPHLEIAFLGGLLDRDQINFWKIYKEGFPVEDYPVTDKLRDFLHASEPKKKELVKCIEKERGKGKSTNYAAQYGAGAATVARTAKIEKSLAQALVKSYKRLNWSIEAIAKDQKVIVTSFGKFQLNPLNDIYYNLKVDKDAFSTLIQGSGSYILDLWILKIYKNLDENTFGVTHKDVKLLATFHDEIILEFDEGLVENVRRLVSSSLEEVNQIMTQTGRITIPFGCSIQFGKRYSEIH